MTETKQLEITVQVERIYNVQELIADMKMMGGQVGEYALVVERLCEMLDRQEKKIYGLEGDLKIAEAEIDRRRELREEESSIAKQRMEYKDGLLQKEVEKNKELEAEIDTLKTRIKALEPKGRKLCTIE